MYSSTVTNIGKDGTVIDQNGKIVCLRMKIVNNIK